MGMGEIGDLRGVFWRTIYPFLSGFGRSLFGPFRHCSCSVGGNGKKRKKLLLAVLWKHHGVDRG